MKTAEILNYIDYRGFSHVDKPQVGIIFNKGEKYLIESLYDDMAALYCNKGNVEGYWPIERKDIKIHGFWKTLYWLLTGKLNK